jgi:hypothetical protein
MPNYIDPVEEAYNRGQGSVVAERAVGLRGKTETKRTSRLKRLNRLIKMAILGSHYKVPQKRKKASEVLPTQDEIDEYNRLGGSTTEAGRAYRRKWMAGK